MAYVPQSGSVVAFQSNPSVLQALVTVQGIQGHSISGTVVTNPVGSVITVAQSSVAVAIVSGSIAASFTPPANQSVSGTVQTAQSGTVITSLVGVSAFPSADSAAIQNNLPVAAFPVVFNGTNWDRLRGNSSVGALVSTANTSVITVSQSSVAVAIVSGSITASFTPPANQSVSGTVTANQGTNPWIITGSVQTTISGGGNSSVQLLAGSAVIGSVMVLQGTNPIIITGSVQTSGGTTGNSSVQLLAGTAAIGSVTVLQGTNPFIITGSVQGSFSASGNQSVSGTVMAQGQVAPGASVIGNPVYVGGVDLNGSIAGAKVVTVGSIAGGAAMLIFGSVQTSGGTTGNSSVQVLNTVTVQQSGTLITSIVSTIPSSVIVGASIFGLAPVSVQNTNLNVSGSVVAFQGTNPWVITGSVQALTQPGSIMYGHTSTVGTGSVAVIAAAGSGLKTYITNYNVSNTGSVATLVTFTDGDASIIGRTIAPASGGSNAILATPMVTSANQPFNMTSASASSVLYGAFYGYKAP